MKNEVFYHARNTPLDRVRTDKKRSGPDILVQERVVDINSRKPNYVSPFIYPIVPDNTLYEPCQDEVYLDPTCYQETDRYRIRGNTLDASLHVSFVKWIDKADLSNWKTKSCVFLHVPIQLFQDLHDRGVHHQCPMFLFDLIIAVVLTDDDEGLDLHPTVKPRVLGHHYMEIEKHFELHRPWIAYWIHMAVKTGTILDIPQI